MQPVILIGTTVPQLGWDIAERYPYSKDPINPKIIKFANGELFCEIERSVRGSDCYVIQSICATETQSVNDSLMELLIMVDALKRASAASVTAVIPHLGYARQDRKTAARTPITSKLVANLLQIAGVNHILSMDLHSLQGQGFYDIPFDNLSSSPVIIKHLKDRHIMNEENWMIVSPDAGGMGRARSYAKKLKLPVAMIDKRRTGTNQSEVMHLIGDVKGKKCIIVDDMIDTGGTIIKGAKALKANGAEAVVVACTHGVFSNDARSNLFFTNSINSVIHTDTLPEIGNDIVQNFKIKRISVASIFTSAMCKIITGESISKMFD